MRPSDALRKPESRPGPPPIPPSIATVTFADHLECAFAPGALRPCSCPCFRFVCFEFGYFWAFGYCAASLRRHRNKHRRRNHRFVEGRRGRATGERRPCGVPILSRVAATNQQSTRRPKNKNRASIASWPHERTALLPPYDTNELAARHTACVYGFACRVWSAVVCWWSRGWLRWAR